jgi:putative ATPase
LSRSQIFTFEPLKREHIRTLIAGALADPERGLGKTPVTITDEALAFLAEVCDGDARRALTAIEIGVKSAMAPERATGQPASAVLSNQAAPTQRSPIIFDLTLAQDSIQRKVLDFDPTGDTHYDLASAFIKSMRGSDPDAAIYWLARMLEGGEDPRFVARRLVIFASEDVGNADPMAILIANAAWDAVERVGLPECRLNLSHAVCYLATAPKSNACTMAIGAATKDVKEGRTLPVPKHLKDAHYQGAKQFGHGTDYKYAHNFGDGWVDQEYIPTDVEYYRPTDRGHEAKIKARLEELRKRKGDGGQKPTG